MTSTVHVLKSKIFIHWNDTVLLISANDVVCVFHSISSETAHVISCGNKFVFSSLHSLFPLAMLESIFILG